MDVPFIKGLSYDFNYSTTRYHRDNNTFYPADVDGGFINNGKAVKEPENENAYLFNHIFAFQREFGDHSLNATFVYTTEKRWGDKTTATAESFDTDNLGYNNLGIGTLFTEASTAWQESNVGLMGRVNYSYKNRYLLTGTVRRDGYSGFGSNNKYVTLPSASIGWVISEEDFNPFEDTYLKLRLSYGQNGNQGIGRYASLAKLGLGAYNYNDDKVISLYPSAMANKDLKWERTSSWNFGVDFGFFNQRLNGSFEVYKSKTSDVLVKRTLPNVTGYSWVWANLGGVENKGLEVELNSVNGSERSVLHGRNSRRRRKGRNGRSTILRGKGRCRRSERSGCGARGNAFGKSVDSNDKQRQRDQRKHGHNTVFIAIPRSADDIRQRADQRDRAHIHQRDQQECGRQRNHVTQAIVATKSR